MPARPVFSILLVPKMEDYTLRESRDQKIERYMALDKDELAKRLANIHVYSESLRKEAVSKGIVLETFSIDPLDLGFFST